MKKDNDIFDRIMSWKIFGFINPFYKKHKEVLLYLLFGGLTTVISIVTYAAFIDAFKMNVLIANIISWVIAVLFAFITNRIWVFASPTNTVKEYMAQMFAFYSGRLATLAVEEAILWIFIDLLDFSKYGEKIGIKIVAQIIVIVLNYIISKCFVFKKKKEVSAVKQ